jgi:hypothetical protein
VSLIEGGLEIELLQTLKKLCEEATTEPAGVGPGARQAVGKYGSLLAISLYDSRPWFLSEYGKLETKRAKEIYKID